MTKTKAVKKAQNVVGKPKGPRALAAFLPKVAEPALRKRGFSAAEFLTHWPEILGPALARECIPERLNYPKNNRAECILFIRASGSAALEIQHQGPIILERINTYFGFKAVTKISIIQSQSHAKPKNQPKKIKKLISKRRSLEIDADLAKIKTKGLNQALKRLGRTIELNGTEKE